MKTYLVQCEHVGNEAVVEFNEIVELDDASKYNNTDLIEEIYLASNGYSDELPRPACSEINNLTADQKILLKKIGGIPFKGEEFLQEYESWIEDFSDEDDEDEDEEDY